MFRYDPAANYQPNGGRYLQILSGKDLYKQTIVVSDRDTFPARFPNIFVDYLLGQMRVGANFSHKKQEPQPITHDDGKLPSYYLLQVVLQYGIFFAESSIIFPRRRFCMGPCQTV